MIECEHCNKRFVDDMDGLITMTWHKIIEHWEKNNGKQGKNLG